jgi:dipicolinate synthase subunit A
MLTGSHIVFVGGDARQLEMIQRMVQLDASVTLIGFDHLNHMIQGTIHAELTEEVLANQDVVLLPAVGTDDFGYIDAVFSSKALKIMESHIENLPKHAKIYTGLAKPYLRKICSKYDISLVELFERDDVAIFNSIPTAEGALMLAIQNTDITIHDSTALVLGFGRTGITMARVLQGLGANVRVGLRKEEHFARAYEMKFDPFYTDNLQSLVSNADLVFNTVPSLLITAQVIASMPQRTVIIDLASKPGGTDFRFAERRGIKAILAPGLPGIVAPKTAGRILASIVSQIIMQDVVKRGTME